MARMHELLRREENLYDCGTTCALKDKGEGQNVCLSCPLSLAETEVTDETPLDQARKRHLCRIGREQQTIGLTLMIQDQQQSVG